MLSHEKTSDFAKDMIMNAPEFLGEPMSPVIGNAHNPNYLEPMAKEAFHGVVGDIVRVIAPHTEADDVAVLMTLLAACGAAIGRNPHYIADGARHGVNLFVCAVGDSGKGRKGTSWKQVRRIILPAADGEFESRIASGLSSGEGLINLVRDASGSENGDKGISDKRLFVVESEFASPMKVMCRAGNILSPVIRTAWDGDKLQVATKNNPLIAADPHISILTHITKDELSRNMTATEAANGFGNRFLWVGVRRSKCLPYGGNLDDREIQGLADNLRAALAVARRDLRYRFDADAGADWENVYPELSEGKPGLLGAMINRAEAQVVRLALLYAALDGSGGYIRPEHLHAALAVWDYCERSARWAFGERLGDALADTILKALEANPHGMTRTEISNYLGRNEKAERISAALQFLLGHGKVIVQQETIVGAIRPIERWIVTTNFTNLTKSSLNAEG